MPADKPRTFADILSAGGTILESDFTDNDSAGEEQKPTAHVPIDWSVNTRIRILSSTPISANGLKTNQEASGITSFVRCLDLKTASTGLDISPGARFHQSTLYWQHPSLPWLTLFPRMAKQNNGFSINEPERIALAADWVTSFRSLFQLLRARQCPYFYVCANTFTVLFRAAGIGGRTEMHAMLTPTSRGMRAALKQEDIEFVMPLKKVSARRSDTQQSQPAAASRSFDSGTDHPNSSFSNSNEDVETTDNRLLTDDEDDDDHEKWLASLGVDDSEIRKISSVHSRAQLNAECAEDFSDQSIVLVEGVECQAFFNFLLNMKSLTANVGRMAGVPPTLLAPICFPGATLRNLSVRSSKVRMDAVEYYSVELKGVVLPHILQSLCAVLRETKDVFSATMTSHASTVAFSRAAQQLIEGKSIGRECRDWHFSFIQRRQ